MSIAAGDEAQRLLNVALDLAVTVRDEHRDVIAQQLNTIPANDKDGLLVVLAALVDVGRPVGDLLSWVTWDENGNPLPRTPRCRVVDATTEDRRAHAAYERLRRQGVPLRKMPTSIVEGQRSYDARRHNRRRKSA